jgi:signal transduction histidine kinase/CheY-like chemotaxis protein
MNHTSDIGPPEAELNRLIELERLRLVCRQMPTSISGTMVGVCLVAAIMWTAIPHTFLLAWVASMAANQSWRLKLYLSFRQTGIDAGEAVAFGHQWFIGSAVSGVIWSIASVFFFVSGSPLDQTLLITSIFAITAVAVPLTASHPKSFFVFVIPILLSLILRNAWEGDSAHLILAFVVAAMMVGILAVGRRYSVALNESLRARFENEALANRLYIQNAELEQARNTAEAANRAKTRFFAAASHDLRQPLHAIGLFADVLASRLGKGENSRLAGNINASVSMLESLFTELLNISRIDAGVIKPELADFDLYGLLERLCDDFEAEALKKGLQLRLHAQKVAVHSDPHLVERILRNLIGNALRYTEQGGILVGCRRRGAQAWVEVWDTGVGIAADQQAAVFEEFLQLANPERNLNKGMGLGLSIVKRLAEVLDLPLSMHSRPGRGTRFRVALPTTERAAQPAAGEYALGPVTGFFGRRILLVDDEESVRQGTTTLLENWGAQVIACRSLAAAEAAARGLYQPPDLIVSNYVLPDGTDGAKIVSVLRNQFAAPIPAIVLARAITPELAEEARLLDFHLLLKPLPPAKLRALISAKLSRPE